MKRILSVVTLIAFLLTCVPAWAADEASASAKVILMHEFAEGEKGTNWSTVKEDGVTYENGYDVKWTPGEKLGTDNHMAYFKPYNSSVNLADIVAVNPDTTVNVRYKTTSAFNFGMSFFWYDGGFSSAAGISRNKVTGDGTWQVFSISLAKLLENTSKDLVQTNWDSKTIYLALDNVNPSSDGVGVFTGSAADSVYVDSWWLEGVEASDFLNSDVTLLKEFMKNQSGDNWSTTSVEGVTYNDGYDLVWTPGEKLAEKSHLATIANYASPVDIKDILDFSPAATLNIRYKTTNSLDFGVSYYWYENGCRGSGGVKRYKVTGDGTWQVFSIPLSEAYAATQASTATDVSANWNGKTIYLALDNQNTGSFTGSATDSVYVDSWWLEGADVYDLVSPEITLMDEVTASDRGDRWTVAAEEGVTWENGYDAKWTPGTNLNTGIWFATILDYEAPIKLADIARQNPEATVNVRYKTTSALDFGMSFYWYEGGAKSAGGINRNLVSGDGTWQVFTKKLSELLASTTAQNATGIAANWNGKTMFFGLDNQNPNQAFSGTEEDSVYIDSWWLEGINADAVAKANSSLLVNFGTQNTGDRWEIVAEDNKTYLNGYDLKWTPGEKLNTTDYLARISNYTADITLDEILEINPNATLNVRYRTTTPLNFGLTVYWYSAGCSSSGGAIRNKVTGDGSWQVFTKNLSDLVSVAKNSANAQANWDGKSIYIALDNVNPGNVFSGTADDSVYVDSWWIDGVNLYNLAALEKFTYTVASDGTAYITGYNADNFTEEELRDLEIPDAVGRNNEYPVVSVDGFENNTTIETLTLPDSVTFIGSSAFYNCTNLRKVTAPGVASIDSEAFRQTALSMFNSNREGMIIFPGTLTTIGSSAFRGCHSVKNVVFSNSINSVGNNAFYRSRGLESFYFPAGMTMSADAYYRLYDGYEGLDDVITYADENAEVLNYVDDPNAADIYQAQDDIGVSDGNMLYANLVVETGDVLVLDEIYTDSDEQPLLGTNKTAGKTSVIFSGYAYNTSDENLDFKVILTVKSAGKMLKGVGIEDASLGANSAGEITCSLELGEGFAIADDDEIRVILLDSVETILPVSSKYNGFTVDADKLEYNVMAIGNSFAQDSMTYLKAIAAADGIVINSYDCYIGGQTLGGHYERLQADDSKYEILPEGLPSGVNTSINNMLTYRDWDYVLLQGTTHDTRFDEALWNDNSEAWTALTNAVATLAPNAKRYVHATWAPYSEQAAVVQSANPDYIPDDENLDARGDYTKALIPHQEFGAEIFSTEARYDNSGKKAYVPTMVAVDYAIRHFGFDEHTGTLTDSTTHANNKLWDDKTTTGIFRDTTCHLTSYVGRVLAGFVWYEMLTGNDVRQNLYTNGKLTDEQIANLKEAAHYACTNYATYDPALVSAN